MRGKKEEKEEKRRKKLLQAMYEKTLTKKG